MVAWQKTWLWKIDSKRKIHLRRIIQGGLEKWNW